MQARYRVAVFVLVVLLDLNHLLNIALPSLVLLEHFSFGILLPLEKGIDGEEHAVLDAARRRPYEERVLEQQQGEANRQAEADTGSLTDVAQGGEVLVFADILVKELFYFILVECFLIPTHFRWPYIIAHEESHRQARE